MSVYVYLWDKQYQKLCKLLLVFYKCMYNMYLYMNTYIDMYIFIRIYVNCYKLFEGKKEIRFKLADL